MCVIHTNIHAYLNTWAAWVLSVLLAFVDTYVSSLHVHIMYMHIYT